ncbi:protein of unknown function [Deinococcus reticulitermitis]|uniref:DUF1788 domain-containing protein n=1 Tax=Deinococcus reticulitermitis TaxID=856736 RepID=A0A1H6WZZ4_9DEIO|nr:BREX protein BrxB domain-containing protein [Deinococcus reticulitermitis]SEJ17865.1 protein of unknown function [Deinococcus reticulitermitis]
MSSFAKGLRELEEILQRDPRRIDDYGQKPFAVLLYDPADEFLLAQALDGLVTRLNGVRQVRRVSFAQLLTAVLDEALEREGASREEFFELERDSGSEEIQNTLVTLLDRNSALTRAVADSAEGLDPFQDVLVLERAGSLYPYYRVNPLLESLARFTQISTVLCYPGTREGISGLSFMGTQEVLRGYRQRIF